jgi:hypothetical protein
MCETFVEAKEGINLANIQDNDEQNSKFYPN